MYLEKIAVRTRARVAALRQLASPAQLLGRAEALGRSGDFPFEKALSGQKPAFICEIKQASPSQGLIVADFPYLAIARDYAAAGAAALSCLTEPFFFQGADTHLEEIARNVPLPVLRKDFILDEMMISQARILGAAAVLLICALLDPARLRDFILLADHLGLSALVEAHTEAEVDMALSAGARVLGVNHRDLRSFTIDLDISRRLRRRVPPHVLYVAESGIQTRQDIIRLQEAGVDGVLVGESLMRAADRQAALRQLRGVVF